MVLWFQRGVETSIVEVRELPGTYELHMVDADGVETVERIDQFMKLRQRVGQLQQSLAAEGWVRARAL
ncbi:MAG TPA: hypothetical protein VG871_00360 [Vicinamibacterales bacterium]|nr:hypothetical protein [Vicinamibacterales bacterium]